MKLGKQTACVLRRFGWSVQWREYAGAEQGGHQFKVPNEMDEAEDVKRAGSSLSVVHIIHAIDHGESMAQCHDRCAMR